MARPILTASQMRDAEQAAVDAGTPLAELMQRAGAALGALALRVASGRPILICAGPGNNGGDGYVAARWLRMRGADVSLEPFAPLATALAIDAASDAAELAGPARTLPANGFILVDCLFGTGLNRALSGTMADRLAAHARGAARIIAADLPSGVDSDSGALLGCAVTADITLAFGALKPAHLLEPASGRCGTVQLADIGLHCVSDVMTAAAAHLAPPDAQSHKYNRGLVAVVAGTMAGAAELAARAALRSGAGYVRLLGSARPPSAPFAIARHGFRDADAVRDSRIGAIVIGCGLGQDESARMKMAAALASAKPLVIDADALGLIGDLPFSGPTILTPHSGEFARIATGISGDKIAATRALAMRTNAVVIHKGADTVIAAPDGRVAISPQGCAWLATAGSGDVLAGICGAMLARGLDAYAAAQTAVLLHQRAARRFGPGLCADDLIAEPIWP